MTDEGRDPLLSKDENCATIIDAPNEIELNHAFTRKMSHMFYVVRVPEIRRRRPVADLSNRCEQSIDSSASSPRAKPRRRTPPLCEHSAHWGCPAG